MKTLQDSERIGENDLSTQLLLSYDAHVLRLQKDMVCLMDILGQSSVENDKDLYCGNKNCT